MRNKIDITQYERKTITEELPIAHGYFEFETVQDIIDLGSKLAERYGAQAEIIKYEFEEKDFSWYVKQVRFETDEELEKRAKQETKQESRKATKQARQARKK
jgi:hypothetical protein